MREDGVYPYNRGWFCIQDKRFLSEKQVRILVRAYCMHSIPQSDEEVDKFMHNPLGFYTNKAYTVLIRAKNGEETKGDIALYRHDGHWHLIQKEK